MDACEVRVPATSANVGPGFDCLGLALGTHLRIAVSPSAEVEVAGAGPPRPPARNLTWKSFSAAFHAAGATAPPMRFETLEAYASARGMGASASAIVAGLVAARAVGRLELDDTQLAGLAVAIEGHADNVLPALFGGVVLARGTTWVRARPPETVAPLVLVARRGLRTSEARRVLPESVPRPDAVHNVAATGALLALLTGVLRPAGPDALTEALLGATEDRLHEPYRLPLMPETQALHTELRGRGIPTAMSGAGPSLLCLVPGEALDAVRDEVARLLPEGWQLLSPGWDVEGARIA